MNPQTLIKNPLMHNGTSQQERLLRMLLPQNYQLDDRSFKDLIVAAYQYADLLYYYDETNTPNGDWQCFWEVEPLTFLAAMAALDTDAICQFYEDVEKVFDEDLRKYNDPDDDTCVTAPSAYYYLELINHIYKQAKQIELFYQKLPADLPLKGEIRALISKTSPIDTEQLVTAFAEMIRYYKAIKDDLDPALFELFYSEHWQLPDRETYDSNIRFKPDGSYDQDKLRKLFHTFYLALIKIKQRADYWFERNLASPELRQPHVALFLTFLHLFRHAQDSLNTLTKRHLDYYYTEVLCLDRRPETPDEVYLIFELSKDFNSYLVEKGTELLAGKDKDRKPLLFETIEDWVVNKAQVAELKNIYFDHTNPDTLKKIYAAPDARFSYDQQGNPVEDQSTTGWRALGDDEALPKGEIGFAIASPQLILREGKRIVDVDLKLDITPGIITKFTNILNKLNSSSSPKSAFQIELSSPEEETGWMTKFEYIKNLSLIGSAFNNDNKIATIDGSTLNVNSAFFRADLEVTDASKTLKFRIVLNEEDSPVDKLVPPLATQYPYAVNWPTLKILISDDINNPAEFYTTILREIKVTSIEIRVTVTGIREKLIVQSDLGIYDGTQVFFPFGPVPEKGKQFYIGSTEVFQKALDDLRIGFDWIDPPSNFIEYYGAYGSVPDPTLKIDFIDKANQFPTGVPNRITWRGVDFTNSVSGKITDINGNPLKDVVITASPTPTNPAPPSGGYKSDEQGLYAIPGLANNATLGFSYTNPDSNGPKLEPFTGPDAVTLYNNQETPINPNKKYSSIDIVLYPRRVEESNSVASTKKLKGKITDLVSQGVKGGVEVSWKNNVRTIKDDSDATTGEFELDFGTIAPPDPDAPMTLLFKYGETTEKGTVEIEIKPNPFPNLDIRLLPLTINRSSLTGQNAPPAGTIQGKLIDAKPSNSSGQGVHNVTVSAKDSAGQIISAITPVKTDRNGKFTIAGATISKLEFKYANFKPLTVEVGTSNDNDFQITHFPKIISQTATITGIITDFASIQTTNSGNPLPGVEVKVKDTTIRVTSSSTGEYELLDVPIDGSPIILDLSYRFGGNPYTGEITISDFKGDSTIDIVFFPVSFTSPAGTAGALNVQGKIIPGGGLPAANNLSGAKVKVIKDAIEVEATIDNGEFTLIDSRITFTANEDVVMQLYLTDNQSIYQLATKNGTGADDNKITISPPTAQNPQPTGGKTVLGTIKEFKSGGEVPLKDAKVFEGTDLATSDAMGEYSLIIPAFPKTVDFKLTTYLTLNGIELKGPSKVDVWLPSQQFYALYEGVVRDIFDAPIQNVDVTLQSTPIKTKSDNTGNYKIAIPEENFISLADQSNQSKLIFKYPTDDFKETSVKKEIFLKYSIINIRLYSDINEFKLIVNEGANKVLRPEKFDINIDQANRKRDVRTQEFSRYSPTLRRGFLRLTLQKDTFRHQEYPNLLIQQTIALSSWLSIPANADNDPRTPEEGTRPQLPNPPYTPATNTIRLDYASTQVIMGDENDGIDQFFHLLPFNGFQDISLDVATGATIEIVEPFYQPSFDNNHNAFAKGNLYIGLQDLTPGENISLLIKVLEGSERQANALPPVVIWSYLAKDNHWVPFSATQILRDSTKGLTRTGIIQFATSRFMVKDNTLLNNQLHWIRASAHEEEETGASPAKRIAALPDLVAIRAQVIQARFHNNGNDLSHLAKPLPATTINKLAVSRAAVKKIEQPYASFNGRLPETVENSTEYYIRISERLRHRNRAITIWDYEHITLEQFPKVHRAKCISHSNLKTELAPGYVTVAVIPDLTQRDSAPDTTPEFSQGDLQEMAEYLRTKANYFVSLQDEKEVYYLQVVNPIYETILLDFQVAFNQGVDREAFRFILDQDLKDFLCPWLANSAADITFGMPLHRSSIIEFIEQRPYVDALSNLKIYKDVMDLNHLAECEVTTEAIYPLTSRSILTTFIKEAEALNETDHLITVVEEKLDLCAEIALP